MMRNLSSEVYSVLGRCPAIASAARVRGGRRGRQGAGHRGMILRAASVARPGSCRITRILGPARSSVVRCVSSTIHVSGLNVSVTYDAVHDLFSEYGEVQEINAREMKHEEYMAFVHFDDPNAAMSAVDECDGALLLGGFLHVTFVDPMVDEVFRERYFRGSALHPEGRKNGAYRTGFGPTPGGAAEDEEEDEEATEVMRDAGHVAGADDDGEHSGAESSSPSERQGEATMDLGGAAADGAGGQAGRPRPIGAEASGAEVGREGEDEDEDEDKDEDGQQDFDPFGDDRDDAQDAFDPFADDDAPSSRRSRSAARVGVASAVGTFPASDDGGLDGGSCGDAGAADPWGATDDKEGASVVSDIAGGQTKHDQK